jgi:hypothetical protein
VSDGDAEILRYLVQRIGPRDCGGGPGEGPFDGPLTVRTGDGSHILGRRVASQIRVRPAGSGRAPWREAIGDEEQRQGVGAGRTRFARHKERDMTAWLVGVMSASS